MNDLQVLEQKHKEMGEEIERLKYGNNVIIDAWT